MYYQREIFLIESIFCYLPIKIKATAITKVRKYPRIGSLSFSPLNHAIPGYNLSRQSAWNTFGAETNDAKALESVAAKQPA